MSTFYIYSESSVAVISEMVVNGFDTCVGWLANGSVVRSERDTRETSLDVLRDVKFTFRIDLFNF